MAKARAVIDVVGAEARAHELLEEIRLLVRAFRGAVARERIAVLIRDRFQPIGRQVERFIPSRFAEHLGPVAWVDREIRGLLHPRLADERLRQRVRMVRVIEPVTSLHAQPIVIRRAVLAGDELNLVFGDVIGEQTPDAAEWADAVHLLLDRLQSDAACRHQRAGGARLHAFAAGDAGRLAHRVVEIEHRHRPVAAVRIADDVVDLHLAAGAHAARALDAGVEVHRDRRVRNIALWLLASCEPGIADAEALRPLPHLVVERVLLLRHIREQRLEHHLLRAERARRIGGDFHARGREAAAGGGERALALDLDHAGATVAVGALIAAMAQVRNVDAVLACRLDDLLVWPPDHGLAVQLELDRHHRELVGPHPFHHCTSCGKYFSTLNAGLGAAWPSPQIEASIIACESSASSGWFQRRSFMSSTAFAVPTRHGVHLPQDSSWKNLIRLSAAAAARSRCDSTTTAAEPMKQPCGCSVSKSSGMSAFAAGRMPPEAPPGR